MCRPCDVSSQLRMCCPAVLQASSPAHPTTAIKNEARALDPHPTIAPFRLLTLSSWMVPSWQNYRHFILSIFWKSKSEECPAIVVCLPSCSVNTCGSPQLSINLVTASLKMALGGIGFPVTWSCCPEAWSSKVTGWQFNGEQCMAEMHSVSVRHLG